MKKNHFNIVCKGALGIILILSAPALLAQINDAGVAKATAAGSVSSASQEFVRKASVAGEFEVESSKLALEKSQNRYVKEFAQDMIKDHTKIGAQLEETLQTSKPGLKAEQNLDEKHQKLMNTLQSLATDDFNREYVSIQMSEHKEAVTLFSDYSTNGDDQVLKDFAVRTLPILQEHLEHAEKLGDKL